MLAVRLPNRLEERLSELAKQTHRSKSYYVKQAIEDFLNEYEEHLIALSRLEKNNPRITLEEMERRLDLED
ncbi:TraY domain-containing protein [Legionella londiniensis]|uniref:Relaxosome protein TraY n=1 Tax=Legionella londiniensis TaxID=45068 RepID=A0A0W0VJT4_9GAMM|nr:ribbon-helix-helix domain-containing protein [Legionella londiniensis]KTD20360.1 Ribbon-helix-helix protein, copG family [Legionella londiniensis]STX93963.1 Ribbon-helix-helix protein, copG family [Legionella londiniensis]